MHSHFRDGDHDDDENEKSPDFSKLVSKEKILRATAFKRKSLGVGMGNSSRDEIFQLVITTSFL